jgi:hypothetical protein
MSEERLQRQLRAQAVVNRQLHAQLAEVTAQLRAVQGNDASTVRVLWRGLEAALPNKVARKVERRVRGVLGVSPPPPARPKRPVSSSGGPVAEWLDDLSTQPADRLELAITEDESLYLLEGTQRRAVPRMLVGALLEGDLGPPRDLTNADLDAYDEGPPVEVLAASTGYPFVVMGGRRRPIRGYPVPFVIDEDDAERFQEGDPLRVAHIGRVRVPPKTEPPPSPASALVRRARTRWLP